MHDSDTHPETGLPGAFAHRLTRAQLVGLDCVAAVGYPLLLLVIGIGQPLSVATGVQFVVAVATALPLTVRRLWPVPVFVLVMTMTIVEVALGATPDPFLAAGFALYPVAVRMRPRRWIPTTAIAIVTVAGLLVLATAGPVGGRIGQLVASSALGLTVLGGSWTISRVVRDRRMYADRAARRFADELLAREKLHIARELHDVVAHSMSLIAVKASVANHVAKKHPEEAHHALEIIEHTSKSTLTEIRRILGVLRSESDDTAAPLAPAPCLSDLPGLVSRATMAGVTVRTSVTGTDDLPSGVDMSAYRIVQEAVTNVVKHAAPAQCDVTVAVRDGGLEIEVRDDGPGVRTLPPNPAGHGLIGMSERVSMLDGTFAAGPGSSGGFTVTARIPLPGPAPARAGAPA